MGMLMRRNYSTNNKVKEQPSAVPTPVIEVEEEKVVKPTMKEKLTKKNK